MKETLVVYPFKKWDKWFSEGKIAVKELGITSDTHENQGVILADDGVQQCGMVSEGYVYKAPDYFPCKIAPKNLEQKIALSLLKNENIPLKILSGVAGSGKTLLACAHAIHQLKKCGKSKIIIAKSMTPVGREIGFLKGTMEDKVRPWLGPFYDNFVHCGLTYKELEGMMMAGVLEITPITFIQGRSISNAIIIIDEVQNLDITILKQIITRAAEGSQIVLLGDQTQVFEKIKDQSIDYLIARGRDSKVVASIHLSKSLRSPLADWAVENL